ncbi:MAG: hypothetical protein Q4E31_13095, partial [Intestinibacter bartlettii]|uniref:hypothetical protein n=1 Tax=Intestinibacter bartlettii TaxID=261299 RepID=UPI0026EA8367
VDKYDFKESINEEDPNTTVEKIDFSCDDIYPNILAKLLFNTLQNNNSEKYMNITGRLYYMNRKWMKKNKKNNELDSFYCLEINLDKGMNLTLDVATFSKLKFHKFDKVKNKPQYVIDSTNGQLRRKLNNDDMDRDLIYVQRSINPEYHNTIDFLKISSIHKFFDSKLGILSKFMDDVRSELNDYIKIEHGGYKDYYSLGYNKKYNCKNINYRLLLNNKRLIIQDLVNTDESKKLVKYIMFKLKNDYQIDAKIGSLDKNNFNLRIIYDEEFYKKNKLEDPHNNLERNIIAQHITIEKFNLNNNKDLNKEDLLLTKVLQELIIKENIINKKITLVDWKDYGYNSKMTFVMRKKIKYIVDNEEKYKNIYCKMDILENGEFELQFYDDSNKMLDSNNLFNEFNNIEEIYSTYNGSYQGKSIEGLFYKSINNINTILKTNEFPIPNYMDLKSTLEKINPNELIDTKKIIECLEHFKSKNIEKKKREAIDKEKENFILKISQLNRYEKREKIKKVLNFRSNAGKEINTYLYENLGISINESLKSNAAKQKYFDAVVDIKYIENMQSVLYFVGLRKMSDLKFELVNSIPIREIIGEEKIEFDEIAKLLQVEFVKYKNYTVVPFPFKYIREALNIYINNISNDNKQVTELCLNNI